MRIAMIGQKGVPATHGGVERHVEELGARLVGLGHDVTVYTRPHYTDPSLTEHRGMRLVSLPTVNSKHLDAIVHSVVATFAAWRGGFDVVHYHAIGPCLASPFARLRGRKVVATVHGQDWRRGKWGRAASLVLRVAEWMALRVPHVTISVSEGLAQAYRERTGRPVVYVPNGIAIPDEDDTSVLADHGIDDGRYLLFAGRLVPEKGAHYLIDAYEAVRAADKMQLGLVVAGDTSHSDDYVAGLRAAAGEGVVFTGFEIGGRLAALFRHSRAFVLPSDLEGLPIVLLEALAYGTEVLASDIVPNVEILGEQGRYFRAGDVDDLARALRELARRPTDEEATEALRRHAAETYDWDVIARQTAQVYRSTLDRRAKSARS